MFLSNIETCEDMDEKCTWGTPDCRNSKVVEKCRKTCDACTGNNMTYNHDNIYRYI